MIKKMQRISAKFWAWYRNLSVKKRIVYTLLAFALPIMPGGSVNHVYFFMGSAGCPEVVAPIAGRFMRINPDKIKKGGLLCQDWGYTRWRDPIVFDNDLLSFAYVVNEFDQDAFKSNLHRYYALDPSGYYHGPMGLGIEVIDIDVGLGAIAVNDFSWQYFSHWPHYSTYFDPYVAIQLERGEHSLGDRRSLYYQITAHYSKDNKARGMRKLTTPYQQVDAIEITQAQLDYLRNDGGEPRRFIGPDAPDLSEAQLAYLKPRWAQMDTSDNVQREAGYFSHTLIARLWQSLGRYRWGGGKAFGRTIPAGSPDDPVPTLENVRSVDLTLPTDRCTIVICSPGISSGEAEGVDRSIPGTLGLYEYCPSAQDPRILRRSALLIRDTSELMPAAYYVDRVPKLPLPKDQNVRIGWREILGDNNTVLGLKALPFRYFARFDADNRGSDENCSILEGATNPNPWRGELSDSIKGEANSSGTNRASLLMRFRHMEDDRYEAVIENTRSTRSSPKNVVAYSLGESPSSLALRDGLNYRHGVEMCTGSLKPYSPRLILGSLYEGEYFGVDGGSGGAVPIVYDFDQRRVEHQGKHYRQYTYRPGVPMAEIREFFEWDIPSVHSQECIYGVRQSGEPWAFVAGLTEAEKRNFSDYDGGTFWTELRDGKMPRILEEEEAAALIEQGILPSGPENLRFPRKYEYEREAGYDLEGYL